MKIKKQKSIKFRFVAKLVRFLNRLENDDNQDPKTNGEFHFLKDWCQIFENKKTLIFDVGANVGEYSEDVLSLRKKDEDTLIYSFEPSSAFSELQRKFSDSKKVIPVPFGLSDKEAELEIYADKSGSKLSTIYKRDRAAYKTVWKPTGKAKFIRADSFIKEKNISHINLLKIDVEGHEKMVLEGFGKYLNVDFIDFVQFEYSEANMDSHTTLLELYRVLEKAGFIVAKIMPEHLEIRNYSRSFEHYHYSNWVAINPKFL